MSRAHPRIERDRPFEQGNTLGRLARLQGGQPKRVQRAEVTRIVPQDPPIDPRGSLHHPALMERLGFRELVSRRAGSFVCHDPGSFSTE